MGISKASAQWNGGFKTGSGAMKPEHAEAASFSLSSRFEGKQGSNPEELLGAALAGCFSMALTVALEKAGLSPQGVRTEAEVKLEKQSEGFAITGITLTTQVTVGGVDDAQFQSIAEELASPCEILGKTNRKPSQRGPRFRAKSMLNQKWLR